MELLLSRTRIPTLLPLSIVLFISVLISVLALASVASQLAAGDLPPLVQASSNSFDSCEISANDSRTFPWQVSLRISLPTERDSFWPAVIIGPYTLLADSRTFRAPNRKLRIAEPYTNYCVSPSNVPDDCNGTVFEVSYIKPHPKVGKVIEYWMKAEHDFVLIHLKHPINFTREIRPLCLPSWSSTNGPASPASGSVAEEGDETDVIIEPGTSTLITGWSCKFYFTLMRQVAAYDMVILDQDICNNTWMSHPEFSSYEGVDYKNRICGTPTVLDTTDALVDDMDPAFCGEKGYYSVYQEPEPSERHVLLGRFNGFAQQMFVEPTGYISLITAPILSWIQKSMNCTSLQYACDNGECIPLPLKCDKVKDCSDGSDEDAVYCRSLNACLGVQFECGVYGPCIDNPEAANCDGIQHCENGEDEDPELCYQAPPAGATWWDGNWEYVIFPAVGLICVVLVVVGLLLRRVMLRKRQYLTEEEILEFRQGFGNDEAGALTAQALAAGTSTADTDDEGNTQLNSLQMPYIYDIPKDKFVMGELIGTGAFGEVYKCQIEGKPQGAVAVKVLKKGTVDKETFKTFLVELKIMAYANFVKGGHRNVLRLLGAYTEQIRNLELLIALEYCEYGSITDFLKTHGKYYEQNTTVPPSLVLPTVEGQRPSFHEFPSERYIQAASLQPQLTKERLNTWALEIAEGMSFLARHRIVHGDLALRNILLDSRLTAKIGDFGLSCQIYYYNLSSAGKVDKDMKLPWRWMAPEVLSTMKISSNSDVWSFGVTLWELFTLGGVPYGGLEWNPNFVDQLKCGLRLTKPQYSSDEQFEIIQDCWKYSPEERPTFETLCVKLSGVHSASD